MGIKLTSGMHGKFNIVLFTTHCDSVSGIIFYKGVPEKVTGSIQFLKRNTISVSLLLYYTIQNTETIVNLGISQV